MDVSKGKTYRGRPRRYYFLLAGAVFAVVTGAALLVISLLGMGYGGLGLALGALLLAALLGILAALLAYTKRNGERQAAAERNKAELLEKQSRLNKYMGILARLDAEAEAERARQPAAAYVDPPTFIYFIADRDRGVVKIGISQSPAARLRELQTGNAHPLELLTVIPGKHAMERRLHAQYATCRVNGEWFRLTDELQKHIAELKADTIGQAQT